MTEKEIFEVIKYFKNIYTSINNGSYILFTNNRFVYQNTQYSLLYGQLDHTETNPFKEWSKNKTFLVQIEDINILRSCLKKNIISLDITENEFKLIYKNKEEVEMIFLCSVIETPREFIDIIEKINNIEKQIYKTETLDGSILNNKEILELYLDDSKLVETRTKDKVIEIPFKRILSLLKDSNVERRA